MFRHRFVTVVSYIAMAGGLAIALSGCGIEVAPIGPSATSSTTTAAAATVEMFSGSIVQAGSAQQTFIVSTTGPVQIQLTSVAPLPTLGLGVSLGNWNGTSCTAIANNANAHSGSAALSGVATAGSYCVNVYDVGNVAADTTVTYSLQVTHP